MNRGALPRQRSVLFAGLCLGGLLGWIGASFYFGSDAPRPDDGRKAVDRHSTTRPADEFPDKGTVSAQPSTTISADGGLSRARAYEMRARGDYVLDSEIEGYETRIAKYVARAVESLTARDEARYRALFQSYGFDTELGAQLQSHIRSIYKAKVQAAVVLTDLANAQGEYDRRMRELLGDRYDAYRAV